MTLALKKILMRYPTKFVNSKFARRMVLMEAKVEAAKKSRTEKKAIYIIVDKEGECTLADSPKKGVYTAFKNGSEIALESDAEVTTTAPKEKKKPAKNADGIELGKTAPKKDMSKADFSVPKTGGAKNKSNTTMAKTATKTAPAKKVAAKKAEGTGKATTLILSDAQWAKVEKLTEKHGSIREMVAASMIKTYGL